MGEKALDVADGIGSEEDIAANGADFGWDLVDYEYSASTADRVDDGGLFVLAIAILN
jgi:hypothetical protein